MPLLHLWTLLVDAVVQQWSKGCVPEVVRVRSVPETGALLPVLQVARFYCTSPSAMR
jgi:hypothetical protein